MEPTQNATPDEAPQSAPYNTVPTSDPVQQTPYTPVNESHFQPTQTSAAVPQPYTVNTPGAIILQWLTYAFWGWLIVALIWLISVVLVNAILSENVSTAVPYAIASTIILFPIAFLCDLFYRKHEPAKKIGAAMVIMVVHAVLFALISIGSLIAATFVGIDMAINLGDELDGQLVTLLTALFATLLFAVAFLRTLNPFKSNLVPRAFSIGMIGVTVILLIAAIAGPVATSIAGRDDRRIEASLPIISNAVENYTSRNDKLPSSLNDISLTDKVAESLIKENKVEYIAEGVTASSSLRTALGQETYRYQLCVNYAAKKGSSSRYEYSSASGIDGYSSYINTSSHDKGRTCYKLQSRAY